MPRKTLWMFTKLVLLPSLGAAQDDAISDERAWSLTAEPDLHWLEDVQFLCLRSRPIGAGCT